ncbi:GNAT family N-acetyltransferase [Roseomonas sp. KE0001]|uniref:GNAT family N-acetyltransferase n=1 Tax=Roseomonas sp. KE0001 TaxID=2479201 RepID=UPI0018DFCB45|nr:GNAT family N-acetyltransferase [Roseomonas sp. KE0001]MBI0433174.1 GNAT family N-acetyltransferase [Roseomonas sp. KE0001]
MPDPISAPPAGLRRATPAEAGAVRDLTRAAYARWVPVIGREPRPMTADYDRAVREHRIDVVERDGRMVALIELRPEADHLLIVNVAVAPDCQGRGLGRALLAHAEAVARGLGLAELRLYTNSRFLENLRLYARLGYAVTHEESLPPLGVVIHMRRRLD